MSDNISCPFCGEWFMPFVNRAEAEHPPITECPLFGRVLTIDQWNMRPPKKEVGSVPKVGDGQDRLLDVINRMVDNLTLANRIGK